MHAQFVSKDTTEFLPRHQWLAKLRHIGSVGVIFDCDGTLVASSLAHCRSMQAAATEQGEEMADAWYQERTGLDRKNLFIEFRRHLGIEFDVDQAVATSIHNFQRFIGLVRPIQTTVEFLRELRNNDYPVAVATNAEREIAVQSLEHIGISEELDGLATLSDNVPPKPSPALFELAAKRIGLPPDKVCVVEDSPQGVAAARAANMPAIMVTRVRTH